MNLRVLVVDDEALARQRLRTLLGDCRALPVQWVGEAGNAPAAVQCLRQQPCDVVLLDIHMPGADGLSLAAHLRTLAHPPEVIFVTAHAEHALRAFDLDAADYLTKPVRLERLEQALLKAQRRREAAGPGAPEAEANDYLIITERGRTERVPIAAVLYLKAEYKYVTVRTREREYVLDGSLNELEHRFPALFLRIHRNALVARRALRSLERSDDPGEADLWCLRLDEVPERLVVSRRQLPVVREALAGRG